MSTPNAVRPAKTNTLAIVALVTSILSFFTCIFILSIVAIVTGNRAKRQIAASGDAGAGMAKAGVIIGWISLIWGILGVIVLAATWGN